MTLIILLIISGFQTATVGSNNFLIAELDMETTGIADNDPLARVKLRKLIADKQSAGQLRVDQMIELKNEEIRRLVGGRLLQSIPGPVQLLPKTPCETQLHIVLDISTSATLSGNSTQLEKLTNADISKA